MGFHKELTAVEEVGLTEKKKRSSFSILFLSFSYNQLWWFFKTLFPSFAGTLYMQKLLFVRHVTRHYDLRDPWK